MTYTRAVIHIDDLRLNPKNPRLPVPADDAEQAIKDLLEDDATARQIRNLAKDIAEYGSLDPSRLIMVHSEGDAYVVQEGNRRIAALKLLADPTLAPTSKLRSEFAAIPRNHEKPVPTEVEAVVFTDDREPNHWVQLNHTGENDGVGTVAWGAAEIARFNERSTGTMEIHAALLRWVRREYAGDTAMLQAAEELERTHFTNLKRFLMKDFRPRLGIIYSKKSFAMEYSPAQMRDFLLGLFVELVSGETSRKQPWSRANKDDVRIYLESHAHLLPTEDSKNPEHATQLEALKPEDSQPSPEDFYPESQVPAAASTTSALPISSTGTTPVKAPPIPTTSDHIFEGVDFSTFGPRVAAIGMQAQQLSVKRSPDLCGVLLRVILDLTTKVYIESCGETPQSYFADTVRQAIKLIDPKVESPRRVSDPAIVHLYQDFSRTGAQQGFAAPILHEMVHSTVRVITRDEVLRNSQRLTPLVVAMSDKLRNTSAS